MREGSGVGRGGGQDGGRWEEGEAQVREMVTDRERERERDRERERERERERVDR